MAKKVKKYTKKPKQTYKSKKIGKSKDMDMMPKMSKGMAKMMK